MFTELRIMSRIQRTSYHRFWQSGLKTIRNRVTTAAPMQIKAAGLLAVLFACTGIGLAPSLPCQCKDIGDLRRRVQVANAAINAYKNEIAVMKAQEAKGKTLEFTQERYEKLQFLVKESILQNQSWEGGSDATAKTNSACEIEIDPIATPCIREVLRIHETVHRKACLASKSVTDLATGKVDWKQKETLVELAQEEIDGYTAELAYLDAQLKSAEQDCCKQNRDGWTGTITFSRTGMKESQSGPVKSRIDATRTTEKKTVDRVDHYESIEITGVKSDVSDEDHVSADLEGVSTGRLTKDWIEDTTVREVHECPVSLGGGYRNTSRHLVFQTIESGVRKGAAKVHVLISPGRYSFNFQTQPVPSTIERKETDTTSNVCYAPDNGTKESSRTSSGTFAGLGNSVEGSWGNDPRNPSVLKGSKTRADGAGGTITITWNLTHCK